MVRTRNRKTFQDHVSCQTWPVNNANSTALPTTTLGLSPMTNTVAVTSILTKNSPNIHLFNYELHDNSLETTQLPAIEGTPFSIHTSSWRKNFFCVAGEDGQFCLFEEKNSTLEKVSGFSLDDFKTPDRKNLLMVSS